MVNVAGRSKGCHTCRRRRVRCDERKINGCQRCEKAGLNCEGYVKRSWKFIDEKARIEKRISSSSSSSVQSASPLRELESITTTSSSEVVLSKVPPTPDLKGFRNNIEITFTLSKFTKNFPWFRFWLLDGAEPQKSHDLQALSKLFFGRAFKQEVIVENAAVCYVKGLQNLNSVLRDPEKMLSFSALTSAMKLSMYEFIAGHSTNWVQHNWGIARLVEMRGPEECSKHLEVFEGHRSSLILLFLRSQKRCFLEREEWRTIPWKENPGSKTVQCLLTDILTFLPGLAEVVQTLKTKVLSESQREVQRSKLGVDISICLQSLYRWRTEWETKYYRDYFEVDTRRSDTPFPIVLYFSNLQRAYEITMYHMALLVLIGLGSPFTSHSGHFFNFSTSLNTPSLPSKPPGTLKTTLSHPSQEIDAELVARDICRSAEYHLLQQHIGHGAMLLLVPLNIAATFFETDSRERKWARDVLRKASAYIGFEGKEYVTDDDFGTFESRVHPEDLRAYIK